MAPWSTLEDGERHTTHRTDAGVWQLRVALTPGGSWWAGVRIGGSCWWCLGDGYENAAAAMAACERHVLCE